MAVRAVQVAAGHKILGDPIAVLQSCALHSADGRASDDAGRPHQPWAVLGLLAVEWQGIGLLRGGGLPVSRCTKGTAQWAEEERASRLHKGAVGHPLRARPASDVPAGAARWAEWA